MYFSSSSVPSPNADSASPRARSIASPSSRAVWTTRMPLPPPPADALTSNGKPISLDSSMNRP